MTRIETQTTLELKRLSFRLSFRLGMNDSRGLMDACLSSSPNALGAMFSMMLAKVDVRMLSQAMACARPVVVGSLFLRAEALRKAGRLDEVPALYRRILELDPTSSSAVDHLAGILAYDLRTTAPTAWCASRKATPLSTR